MGNIILAVILYYVAKRVWKKHKSSSATHPLLTKILRNGEKPAAKNPSTPATVVTPKAHPSMQMKKKREKQFEQL